MGPYYVTALVSLLGPVARVGSSTGISFAERTITSQPKHGETIKVNTPTHIAATLDFANGAIATIITSFDLYDTIHSVLTIYGTEGTLQLPDPNTFGGTISLFSRPHSRRSAIRSRWAARRTTSRTRLPPNRQPGKSFRSLMASPTTHGDSA